MKPKIFIVLPVFNRLNFTKKCVGSIFKQSYKNFELILIDDGSTDGTSDFISRHYPMTKIIKGDGNWWWTRCMYEGTKFALKSAKRGDYVLEMNNDLFFGEEYFQELITCSTSYKKSLIGSICVRAQKSSEVVEAGIRIDWPSGLVYGVAPNISKDLNYFKKMDIIDNLDALPGKGTLVPIEVFKKGVHFKYKKFPHYIADYEFAINAKRHGYDLLVCPKAVAKHYWEATGISSKNPRELVGYKKAWNLLFGRKSMNNIIDWYNFIHVACPKKYLNRNRYFLILKIIKASMQVRPFDLLRYPILIAVYCYHVVKYPKLALYRLYLKIIQFPKYHLLKK